MPILCCWQGLSEFLSSWGFGSAAEASSRIYYIIIYFSMERRIRRNLSVCHACARDVRNLQGVIDSDGTEEKLQVKKGDSSRSLQKAGGTFEMWRASGSFFCEVSLNSGRGQPEKYRHDHDSDPTDSDWNQAPKNNVGNLREKRNLSSSGAAPAGGRLLRGWPPSAPGPDPACPDSEPGPGLSANHLL